MEMIYFLAVKITNVTYRLTKNHTISRSISMDKDEKKKTNFLIY